MVAYALLVPVKYREADSMSEAAVLPDVLKVNEVALSGLVVSFMHIFTR